MIIIPVIGVQFIGVIPFCTMPDCMAKLRATFCLTKLRMYVLELTQNYLEQFKEIQHFRHGLASLLKYDWVWPISSNFISNIFPFQSFAGPNSVALSPGPNQNENPMNPSI